MMGKGRNSWNLQVWNKIISLIDKNLQKCKGFISFINHFDLTPAPILKKSQDDTYHLLMNLMVYFFTRLWRLTSDAGNKVTNNKFVKFSAKIKAKVKKFSIWITIFKEFKQIAERIWKYSENNHRRRIVRGELPEENHRTRIVRGKSQEENRWRRITWGESPEANLGRRIVGGESFD